MSTDLQHDDPRHDDPRHDDPRHDDPRHDDHQHDLGLAHDLSTLVRRRQALKLFAGAGLVALVGCGSSKAASSGTTAGSAATAAATTAGSATTTATTVKATSATTATPASAVNADTSAAIPEETAGPYPGDGSNGKNVLTQSGIVRRDIRASLGTSGKVASGIPFTINLQIVELGGTPLAGAAVYLWHCDIDGNYSMYSAATIDETYLRGVQETDGNGNVTFTSVFPGCYSGRWPHVHYEVYPSTAKATSSSAKIATSQLALPEATCKLAYATTGYSASVNNLSRITLATDNVFSDGATREIPSVTGAVATGFVSSLVVPVSA